MHSFLRVLFGSVASAAALAASLLVLAPLEAAVLERNGSYVLVQEVATVPGAAARSNTYAICEVPHVAGASSYQLMSRGGEDPFFYGDRIDRFGPPFDSDVRPERGAGKHWFGLSGAFGPLEAAGDQKAYMDGRFASGWDWRVLITVPEFNVTVSSPRAEEPIGSDIVVDVLVVNNSDATIDDVRLDGMITATDDALVSLQSEDLELGTLESGAGTTMRTRFTALAPGEVGFMAPQVSGRTQDGTTVTATPECDDGADPDAAPCRSMRPTVTIVPCELDVILQRSGLTNAQPVGDSQPPANGEYRPGDT